MIFTFAFYTYSASVTSKFKVSLYLFYILKDTVSHLKPSGSPADAIPPRLFKEVLVTIGPSILEIINYSLSTGTVPRVFKHAVTSMPST